MQNKLFRLLDSDGNKVEGIPNNLRVNEFGKVEKLIVMARYNKSYDKADLIWVIDPDYIAIPILDK